jgi:hypothetical protein
MKYPPKVMKKAQLFHQENRKGERISEISRFVKLGTLCRINGWRTSKQPASCIADVLRRDIILQKKTKQIAPPPIWLKSKKEADLSREKGICDKNLRLIGL